MKNNLSKYHLVACEVIGKLPSSSLNQQNEEYFS